jgi:hypothetical protein
MNLSFKMLLACETAFVYFGTFANRFQVAFWFLFVILADVVFCSVCAFANA